MRFPGRKHIHRSRQNAVVEINFNYLPFKPFECDLSVRLQLLAWFFWRNSLGVIAYQRMADRVKAAGAEKPSL